MNDDKAEKAVARRGRRSLSDEMAMQADASQLRQSGQARYRQFATLAARDEREGRFAAAAENWSEALKTARENTEWCQSRLTLCLLYARTPSLPQAMSERATGR
jgi:hypothetical protein